MAQKSKPKTGLIILNAKTNLHTFINLLLFVAGILLFARFIHTTNAARFLALAALLLPCMALYRHTLVADKPLEILHSPNQPYFRATLLAGLLLGASFAVYYRITIGASPIPDSVSLFAPVAILIGLAEEFAFRGAAFSLVKKWPAYLTIPLTAFLHAAYKATLFLDPGLPYAIDTWFLFNTTFFAGLVIGFLRYAGGSVIPPMVAHGLWDAIVYGDSPAAPWWVW